MPELDLLQYFEIEQQALAILLMLPVVATIVGIARHIVGAKSLGIYAPIVITFSFYAFGLNNRYDEYSDIEAGLKYGVTFLLVIIAATIIGTTLVKKARMHYFPKVSLTMSIVGLSLVMMLIAADLLGRDGFNSIYSFAVLMIASVSEQFTSTMFKKNLKTTLLITLETIMTSVFCYLLIAWPSFQDMVLTYPYLVLLSFIVNIIVGKYRGLRIREYFRFADLLNDSSEIE